MAVSASGAVRYVNVSSSTPASPYTSWATAAVTIQDAVDAAFAGDQILVTNGVYQNGGYVVQGTLTNRLVIAKAVTVLSVNGPAVTTIRGNPVTGPSAVRCVYMTNSAVLQGFTVTGGATRSVGEEPPQADLFGGGILCESLSEVVTNCVIIGNSSGDQGGGVYQGTLYNCKLIGNSSIHGGGASSGALNNCMISSNSARIVYYGNGGGVYSAMLRNCVLTENVAGGGGGADSSTLAGCVLARNVSDSSGGGANDCSLENCTVTGNTALGNGGGTQRGTNRNCILFFNHAPAGSNYFNGDFEFCCTAPLPPNGSGHVLSEPQLADASHLSPGSPCRGVGNPAFASGVDIDGEQWSNALSIGADEYHAGAVTGPLTVDFQISYTNVASGFEVTLACLIGGRAVGSSWNFGDGTAVTNRIYTSHHWSGGGTFPVVLRAYNDTYPGGISATQLVHVLVSPVYYVSLASANPAPPFDSWAVAATNIQDAVDAAFTGGTVLVSNGVYATGARVIDGALSNRVAVTKPLSLKSLNGPAVTTLVGYFEPTDVTGDSAIRCLYLGSGSTASGFTVTNGSTRQWAIEPGRRRRYLLPIA